MPSGYNVGNGHVRTKRPSPVLGGNRLTRPKIAGSCVTVGDDWIYGIARSVIGCNEAVYR